MANNLRKFNTYSDYEAAELVKPAVSLIAATDEVYFDQKDAPVPPTFSGLTVHYNIDDISQPTVLFSGGGSGSGSGSGSGGGALPSAMIIDGTAVEVTNTYQFSTTGEHVVQYSIENPFNKVPNGFLANLNQATRVIVGDYFEEIGSNAFHSCTSISSCTIGSSVESIGQSAFYYCNLTSIDIPSGVRNIYRDAFQECRSLSSITSNAMTAPHLYDNVFQNAKAGGTLTVPSGSEGYCDWMGKLPSGWTIEGVTCGSGSGSGSGA